MASSRFLNRYREIRGRKDSVLCVGLDPATAEMRDKDVVPDKYFHGKTAGEGILDYCIDIVKKTSPHTCAYKINTQYVLFNLNVTQLRKLNDVIHRLGCLSILDHKLGDIGFSNNAALFWTRESGFDALTFTPFAGNIKEATAKAHELGLGIFTLTLMSNPESRWVQKDAEVDGTPLYKKIAEEAGKSGSDGLVIGATEGIRKDEIKEIRETVGEDCIFLCPGIGAQAGDLNKITDNAGENILVNVSRAIIYDENPEKKAREYKELLI